MEQIATQFKRNNKVPVPSDYVERVYAGWLGKVIGVRHGGNVEGWSYERLQKTFGEITDYLYDFKNFAADDDTNGPLVFLRALEDYTHTSAITREQMGLTWLNYVPDGHGFFWWGGYGVSTEHTAYLNLKNGISAPQSGSIVQNGKTVAEQIGGQIFIDVWGLIAPGNPTLAAEYAEKISSVSHDGNGKYGGMFIAACIAAAFVEQDISAIIDAGLSVIPDDCEYTRMVRAVLDYYDHHPDNWRDCFQFVYENFGYDRYPGACHIIPNSAVIVLALLYSKGDFANAINICNMCGWDTDCNVGNVGTIMGVRNGIDGIGMSWREPIQDFLCCSTVLGSLNILDIPWCASYIARFGYLIAGQALPERWASILNARGIHFHFEYPGSTHAFRCDSDADWQVHATVENSTDISATGTRSLKVTFDKARGGCGFRAYHQTYYSPEDFNDSRYDPSFSPILYPGQSIAAKVMIPAFAGGKVEARLYVKDRNSNVRHHSQKVELTPGKWIDLVYEIPSMRNVCLQEAGIEWLPADAEDAALVSYVDSFGFTGAPDYEIDFASERLEVWTGGHKEVSQFTYLRGLWTLEDGQLSGSYCGEPAEIYTGRLDWEDVQFEAAVIPKHGEYHNIQFRVQGAIRSYAVGLAPDGKVALYKNENGYRTLVCADFSWNLGERYVIAVDAVANRFIIRVNGRPILDYVDEEQPYLNGQIGFSNAHGSHTHYQKFSVKGL